ncbi:unnamed protein product [Prorocentrum cordatum]|uniref:Uncharacterized protein n=1 Tax=Prorocentrum cordatum TaxID=2364126 RepID=A0ABN9VJM5_9DINO|nr:unnamed protein product [Polarella glacialis]
MPPRLAVASLGKPVRGASAPAGLAPPDAAASAADLGLGGSAEGHALGPEEAGGSECSPQSPSSDSSGKLFRQVSFSQVSFSQVMRSFLWSKGHRNLLIRGITSFLQASATCVLVEQGIDIPHKPFVVVCQLTASASLVWQWRTADPRMFVLRGAASWGQALLLVHSIPCGKHWIWDHCDTEAWSSGMRKFRIMQIFNLVKMICNGISLFLQFFYPHRMFGGHGNEQLFYRGWIQFTGIPINLTIGILKLQGVDSVRKHELVEIVIDFVRIPIIAVASWSLIDQWYRTGKNNTGHPISDLYESMSRAGQTPLVALRMARRKLRRAHARARERAGKLASAVSRDSLSSQVSGATSCGQVVAVVPVKLASARDSVSSQASGATGCGGQIAAADPEGGESCKSQPEPEPALAGAGEAGESGSPATGAPIPADALVVDLPRGAQALAPRLEAEAKASRWQCFRARVACHLECWL